jgi:hypothetical protein
MPDQHDKTEKPDEEGTEYEAPEVEDLDTSHGPSVTAAGVTASNGQQNAAPREL